MGVLYSALKSQNTNTNFEMPTIQGEKRKAEQKLVDGTTKKKKAARSNLISTSQKREARHEVVANTTTELKNVVSEPKLMITELKKVVTETKQAETKQAETDFLNNANQDTFPGSAQSINLIDLSSMDEDEDDKKEDTILVKHGKISLYKNDLDRLKENKWLNDKIIDISLSLLKPSKEVYIFSSFFFVKLREIQKSKKNNYYHTTKKWFKNNELKSKKLWLIPVCDRKHWYLIAIADPNTNRPVLFVLDSLNSKYYDSVHLINDFLKQKYKTENNENLERAKIKIINVPTQPNFNDCGLHTLRSAELFLNTNAQNIIFAMKDSSSLPDALLDHINVPTRGELLLKIKSINNGN